MTLWDLTVVTTGSDSQEYAVKKQLDGLKTIISVFTKDIRVIRDYPRDRQTAYIGSGISTLEVIHCLVKSYTNVEQLRVLVFHTGGLSQRMPHHSIYGKFFATMASGKTILEEKLQNYQFLVEKLPPGIHISASDVVEYVDKVVWNCNQNSDMIIFAHTSTVEVGKQHGVFVMETTENGKKSLKCVLQKPSVDEMNRRGAITENNTVLTDSMYFLSWKLCLQLLEKVYKPFRPASALVCCYGDYMRPLGTNPSMEYIERTHDKELKEWRTRLWDFFSKVENVELIELGPETFFHYGTPGDFLKNSNLNYFCEFSNFRSGSKIGNGSIVSCVRSEDAVELPENIIIFTTEIEGDNFVTVVVSLTSDIKTTQAGLQWMGRETTLRDTSLWNAKLFPAAESRELSLKKTLALPNEDIVPSSKSDNYSMADLAKLADFDGNYEYKRSFTSENRVRFSSK